MLVRSSGFSKALGSVTTVLPSDTGDCARAAITIQVKKTKLNIFFMLVDANRF
jgi:hypothetical protein